MSKIGIAIHAFDQSSYARNIVGTKAPDTVLTHLIRPRRPVDYVEDDDAPLIRQMFPQAEIATPARLAFSSIVEGVCSAQVQAQNKHSRGRKALRIGPHLAGI
jgi:hypothetical protein